MRPPPALSCVATLSTLAALAAGAGAWSGPQVRVGSSRGVWSIDGRVVTPQFFKVTLTQGYMPPPTGNWTELQYELQLAASAEVPVIAFETNFLNISKWGRTEPGTDWQFDAQHPLDHATAAQFDFVLRCVPHALLWPTVDAWFPGPVLDPTAALHGLENIVLRNLTGGAASDALDFNLSPNKAWLAKAQTQLAGLMRLLDARYPGKIFGIQVNNLRTTEWFLPGAWSPFGNVKSFGTQFADYSNSTALAFCGSPGCLPSPTERATAQPGTNVFATQHAAAFNAYLSARSVDAISALAQTAKSVSDGKAFVGSYYGYLFECAGLRLQGTGITAVARFLNESAIDAIISPYRYATAVRQPAGPLLPHGVFDSPWLHKKM